MNTFKIVILILLINSSNSYGQELKGTWLFNNQEAFITENDEEVSSDIFDFFYSYIISQDTLKIKHIYPKKECSSLDEDGNIIWVPCKDDIITDSWYKINKFTSDSLIIYPLNRSAIAVSAWLKNRPHNVIKKMISDSSYTPSYLQTIKLYNSKTLVDNISWSKIRVSSKSNSWFQEHYEYLEINIDGTFKAFNKIKPFEEGKPRSEYITKETFYEDKLSKSQINELNLALNESGFFHFKIDRVRWSSHGSLIKIQVFDDNGTKTQIGYGYQYPKFALPLIRNLMSIINEKETKQTETEFDIPMEFEKEDGK